MKSKWYRFTVKGSGVFPLDMLRYDVCYPQEQEDAFKILESPDVRTVTLIKPVDDKNSTPTPARWQSFGWEVISLDYIVR